jgi:pimeloyl-ACP methyl ester carboxylesterase
MKRPLFMVCALTVMTASLAAQETRPPALVGPVQGADYRSQYIRLGSADAEGLLYRPLHGAPKLGIALVYAHPSGNNFNHASGREMSHRGYPVLTVNYRGQGDSLDYLPVLSRGIAYLRTLPDIRRVILVGHSGGGHLNALYQNIAEHGAPACQGARKIYPCRGEGLAGLQKPDGLILLDPTLGAFHQMSSVDPAAGNGKRLAGLDMFSPANGYDPGAKRGTYSAQFARRFYVAQAARNTRIVNSALARLQLLSQGKSRFSDDEPLVISGMGVGPAGARLYQPDPKFAASTKAPHLLLRANGSDVEQIIPSVRPPSGQQAATALDTLNVMSQNTTVRRFLAESAIRTAANFAITGNDIIGVDWGSAVTSTPANAEGVSVPALVMTMSCHYLVVPGEIVFDHLGSRDKTYASVEGATHVFTPCRPEYGDTVKRTFDFVDAWLAKPGRF